MAAPQVDAGSDLQAKIQAAVQPKLVENGWVDEENDSTLSEYVTMMIVNGKDAKGVQAELGGDLLGVGEDDPGVGAFAQWLFDTVRQLSAPQQQQQSGAQPQKQQQQQTQPIPTVQDAQMEDTTAAADAPPTGPRSMRNGSTQGRGRGGRMLGQMNRQMDRNTDLPDNLRRIKGASGIAAGRINSHSGRDGPPRGPRGSGVANGVQRMMNGGRGAHQNNMPGMPNPMMGGGPANPQQQMQFMQMMEMQTNMMAQLIASGQMPNMNGNFQNQNQRGGRGGSRGGRGGNKQLHAVNGKMPEGALPGSNTNAGGSGMDIDGEETNHGDKFSTLCRFNLTCTNPTCGFAHQSPAAPPNAPVDLSDTCAHGAACTNHKCSARHPSPAQRSQNGKQEVDCRFFPNCTAGANCPFRHPTEKPCKFGGDCTNPGCKFAHPKIMCRYNPCLNPSCMFKHADGQKRGKFEDKVWTSNGGGEDGSSGKADRFADFAKQTENGEEELVLPGQSNGQQQQQEQQTTGGGGGDVEAMDQSQQPQGDSSSSGQMETQIVV
ncbi:hypothetical protein M409DRAFT_70350 [Zasmidium cellare ATCC 36951]|uniref:C3H1-type domain-containing protein n=1 Tax=Zasmidium cellare ATCC 36951 TaxID=1080233 RepID=A0A6A6C341_ZASCE|nr:uncharacterized protein M409DRAFT_70350 [Zasmidium cellare ATCC 36951]KAF2160610.1 hypothetical protein M409DRAFT_70350 [Zasmidium cellare ATCC 36951]